MDDIAGHEQLRLDVLPHAVTLDPRLERQSLLQERDGIVGLELLPKADAGIDEQHQQDDGQVAPMLEHRREHGRDLDHPRDRPPEEMCQPLDNTDMMFDERVLAILGKPARGFGFAQSCRISRPAAATGVCVVT